MIPTLTFLTTMLANLIDTVTGGNFSGVLTSLKMELSSASFVPSPTTSMASITVATFDGYAAQALSFGSVLVDPSGVAKLIGTACSFRSTDGNVANTLYGYVIHDGATPTPNVLFSGLFPTPIVISGGNQGVTVVPEFDYAGSDLTQPTFLE